MCKFVFIEHAQVRASLIRSGINFCFGIMLWKKRTMYRNKKLKVFLLYWQMHKYNSHLFVFLTNTLFIYFKSGKTSSWNSSIWLLLIILWIWDSSNISSWITSWSTEMLTSCSSTSASSKSCNYWNLAFSYIFLVPHIGHTQLFIFSNIFSAKLLHNFCIAFEIVDICIMQIITCEISNSSSMFSEQ